MQYFVRATGGPGFASPDETRDVLKKGIIPTFDALTALESDKTIVAGGLPVGDRAFYFIIDAHSHDEADRILRRIPAWGVFNWAVVPLQSFTDRAEMELGVLKALESSG